jgi:hypothetical protein
LILDKSAFKLVSVAEGSLLSIMNASLKGDGGNGYHLCIHPKLVWIEAKFILKTQNQILKLVNNLLAPLTQRVM